MMKPLSKRQFAMLQMFSSETDAYMSIEEAQRFDQRPFRSMLLQGWVAYRGGRGFHITKEGKAAWAEFHEADIARKRWNMPLTAYFDPKAYGLPVVAKRTRGAAA
jgi:hypothetical protein